MSYPLYSLLCTEGNCDTGFFWDSEVDFGTQTYCYDYDGQNFAPIGDPPDNCIPFTETEEDDYRTDTEVPQHWLGFSKEPRTSPRELQPTDPLKYFIDTSDNFTPFKPILKFDTMIDMPPLLNGEMCIPTPESKEKLLPRVIRNSFIYGPKIETVKKRNVEEEEEVKVKLVEEKKVIKEEVEVSSKVKVVSSKSPKKRRRKKVTKDSRRRKRAPQDKKKKNTRKRLIRDRNFQKRKTRRDSLRVDRIEEAGIVAGGYNVRVKPCRRINTTFASNGLFPYFICSNPYKYLMEIEGPDEYDDQDYQFYLVSYASGEAKGIRCRSGVDVDLKKVTYGKGTVTQRFQVQFTMTSFLNQSVEFKLFIVDEDNVKVLNSSKFKIVARKVKFEDDRFWNQFLIDPNRYTGQKRKREFLYTDESDEEEEEVRSRRSKRRRKY